MQGLRERPLRLLLDTDILIWIQRGNRKAANFVSFRGKKRKSLSSNIFRTFAMCQIKKNNIVLRKIFCGEYGFQILPFTENIGHRAIVYIEEYTFI